MANKKEKCLSYKFLLDISPEAATEIDKKMLLMQKLNGFIVHSIRAHIEYLKSRTVYGSFCNELYEKTLQLIELEKRERSLDKEIDVEELKEIAEKKKQIKKLNKELFEKKRNLLSNNPESLLRIRLDSRRENIILKQDKITPADTEPFTLNKSHYDGKIYYSHKKLKKLYTIVPGSIHPITDGYKAVLSECSSTKVDTIFDEENNTYVFKENVYKRDAVITGLITEDDKTKFTIIISSEILRLDSSVNDYGNFCSRFARERVYTLNKNKNTGRSQKTAMTYYDYNITSRDLMYALGARLHASFQDFPIERKHRINEFNILAGGDTQMIDLIQDESRYFVSLKTTHDKSIKIPVIECPYNKGRLKSLATNYDRMLLNTAFAQKTKKGKASYTIIRERIRSRIRYYLKLNIDEVNVPVRPETPNSLNQRLGTGILGIDPNAHMIATATNTGTSARIFSVETVDDRRVIENIEQNEIRIKHLKRQMSKSMAGTNPKAIDKDGKYIKGCGIKLQRSKNYLALKKEVAELHRKNAELKKYIANSIAHEILGMSAIVYSELPQPAKAAERKVGIKTDKNGKILSNRGNGRNVQMFAIAGLMNEIRRIFIKNGGSWHWISNLSGATKFSPDGNNVSHSPDERVIDLCGRPVQRDIKSAFCIANSIIVNQANNTKGKPKFYRNAPVWDVRFDADNMMRCLNQFVYSNNDEMERLRLLGVKDYTIGIDDFFTNINTENLQDQK